MKKEYVKRTYNLKHSTVKFLDEYNKQTRIAKSAIIDLALASYKQKIESKKNSDSNGR